MLRAGRPLEDCYLAGDEEPLTRHFGFRDEGGSLVAVVSYMCAQAPHRQGSAYQLRGMAVAEEIRGKGVGGALLEQSLGTLEASGDVSMVWCNAREGARGFYEHHGFHMVRGPFDIPLVGSHYLMERRLT